MKNLKGYILLAELYKKANVSVSLFQQIKSVEIDKIDGANIVKKETVPDIYKKAVEECQDLEYYYPYSSFSRAIGCGSKYLSTIDSERKEKFISKKIQGKRLIKLTKEFIKNINNGLTPFKIDKSSKKYANTEISMQGIRIGFY